jgi:hypothetical protein
MLVVFVAILVITLGELGGALLAPLRPATARVATARIAANAPAHGLTGAAEYDDAVRERALFSAEAGVSFFHVHAEGMGLVLFFASTLVASVVRSPRLRRGLHTLLTAGALFPLGYLAYAVAVVELGRDEGVALVETWVLAPLGSAAIAGLLGLALVLARRPAPGDAP